MIILQSALVKRKSKNGPGTELCGTPVGSWCVEHSLQVLCSPECVEQNYANF